MAHFEIPAENMFRFKAAFEKLEKKGKKLGVPVSYSILEYKEKMIRGPLDPQGELTVTVAVVEVTGERPVINGYAFVAQIEHTEHGNIVNCSGAEEQTITENLRFIESQCQHCKMKRDRKYTYAVQKEGTEEFVIVGKQCLKDFLGHIDPRKLAEINQWLRSMETFDEEKGSWGMSYGSNTWFVVEYLEAVAQMTMNYGFLSGKDAKSQDKPSTADQAAYQLNPKIEKKDVIKITDEAKDVAKRAYEWAFNLKPTTAFEQNMYVYARKETMYANSNGTIAYIIPAYLKTLGQDAMMKLEEPKPKKPSEYQGEVGKKITTEVRVLRAYEGETYGYGYSQSTTVMYILEDEEGNVFKWNSSRVRLSLEAPNKITGTVKAHSAYTTRKGEVIKQTVLTRCKLVEEHKEAV